MAHEALDLDGWFASALATVDGTGAAASSLDLPAKICELFGRVSSSYKVFLASSALDLFRNGNARKTGRRLASFSGDQARKLAMRLRGALPVDVALAVRVDLAVTGRHDGCGRVQLIQKRVLWWLKKMKKESGGV